MSSPGMLAGWSRSHLPSCSPAQGSPVILTAGQMAFLKLIRFLAWVGIFLNLSNPISSFQSHGHHQAVQSSLVWKIPRQQPWPTPKQEQNQQPKTQGSFQGLGLPPLAQLPWAAPPKPGEPQNQLWDWSSWECNAHPPPLPKSLQGQGDNPKFAMPTHHSSNPCRDKVTTPKFPSCQSPPPSSQPCQSGRGKAERGEQETPPSSTPEAPPMARDSPVGPPPHPGVLPVVASPAAQPSPGVEVAPVAATVGAADAGHVGPLGQHLQVGRGC